MRWRRVAQAAGAVALATFMSCSSATARGTGQGASGALDAADVAAARLCHSLDVFATDARIQQPKPADSAALSDALKKLQARPGRDRRWMPLVKKVQALVNDAANSNLNAAQHDGVQAGRECARVPPAAARAGGFD
jgi:hypothetical protein